MIYSFQKLDSIVLDLYFLALPAKATEGGNRLFLLEQPSLPC